MTTADITAVLESWNRGEPGAFQEVFALAVDELRQIAHSYMRNERADHTLDATELVNLLYLRFGRQKKVLWTCRAEFFFFAGKLMRWLLVEHAKARKTGKRGGDVEVVPLTSSLDPRDSRERTRDIDSLLDLDRALERLKAVDPEAVGIIELRYFGGMSEREVAEALDVSRSTVQRKWKITKRLLAVWLDDTDEV